mgnify:CR=1 FL=1
MFFKNFKVWETELAGRKLTLETGKMAGLANASIWLATAKQKFFAQ